MGMCRWMGILTAGLTIMGCFSLELLEWDHTFWDLGDQEIQVGRDFIKMGRVHVITVNQCVKFILGWGLQNYASPKVTKMGSIFGHWIDYDGVGVLRGRRPTSSKKLTQVTPPPPPQLIFNLQLCRRLGWVSFCKDFWDCYWGCTSQLLGKLFSLFPVTVPEVFAKLMTWLGFFFISKEANATTKRSDNYVSEPK